jgi:glycosyltransferase involved in cell wall biosynthesis
LARAHARRADAIITSSDHTKARVLELFGVEDDRLHVVRPGALQRVSGRAVEARRPDGPVLFLGTVERRKNLDVVADAYERLLGSGRRVPRLIVAGGEGPGGRQSLDRLAREPLRAVTEYRGYVSDAERESLLGAARLLVLPSWDEGFGLPALEAMAAGVPVIASNRGSLPEVLGDAAVLLPPDDAAAWAETIDRLAHDDMGLASHRQRGIARAATFTWDETASALRRAYEAAIAHRQARH